MDYDGNANSLTINNGGTANYQRLIVREMSGDNNTALVDGATSTITLDNSSNSSLISGQGSGTSAPQATVSRFATALRPTGLAEPP